MSQRKLGMRASTTPLRGLITLGTLLGGLLGVALQDAGTAFAKDAAAKPPSQPNPEPQAALELSQDEDLVVMQRELERNRAQLKLPSRESPYYVAYWLVGFEELSIEAHLGAIVSQTSNRGRRARVELRVGSPELDNARVSPSETSITSISEGIVPVARDRNPWALERSFWLLSDAAYREALEAMDRKRTERSAEVQLEERPLDFSPYPKSSSKSEPLHVPKAKELEETAKSVSRIFRQYPAVHQGHVAVEAWMVERKLVASDGTRGAESTEVTEFTLRCEGQAGDGMPLVQTRVFHGSPSQAELEAAARTLAQELTELAQAEVAPAYSGPVLFSGVSAPQIAYDLVAEAVSGTPSDPEGAFQGKLGKRVLPPGASLTADPRRRVWDSVPLIGNYLMDDEGVPSQRVDLVENGRLKALLMSRAPSVEQTASNGHGRSGLGAWARGWPSNLILSSQTPVSDDEMKRKLLKAVRAEGGEFGIVVERLEPRAFTSRGAAPPAPERVYKLYPDGHRVLVRGATFREMAVRDLRDVLSIGKLSSVFNVMLPTSGYPIATSFVAPQLLFEQVELSKPKRSSELPKPISRPDIEP